MNDITRRTSITTQQTHHRLVTLPTNTLSASRALTKKPAKNNQHATYNTVDTIDEPDLLLGKADEFEDYISAGAAEESNDNGIKSFAGTDFMDEFYTNTSDLDKDGRRPVTAAKNKFKIKHASSSFRIKHQYTYFPFLAPLLITTAFTPAENFISRINKPDFDTT